MSDMSKRRRRKYTPEQKADALRLVREAGNLAQVARNLDLADSVLRSRDAAHRSRVLRRPARAHARVGRLLSAGGSKGMAGRVLSSCC
ncbi:MAG: hypothetical protein DRQ55_04600 [Planctomycetota bacterium]|nr:MAG: hypothetical protein DRQ55_04600 [Planctomycetota bacterium]